MSSEELLYKSDGVKECVKWIEKKLKKEKEQLKTDEDLESAYGMYENCGSSYRDAVVKREGRMESLVEVKVELEKYMKKLRHEADEV
jgi:hypothetical protein